MIISSAYLFGKQISPGGLPPMATEVYYENGRFNPLYVPQGFDVSNRKISVVGNNYDVPDMIEWLNEQKDHFDDGTTFFMYHMYSYEMPTIEQCLQYNSLTFTNDGIVYDYFDATSPDVTIRLFLPIVGDIINNYDYLIIEYETEADFSSEDSKGWVDIVVRQSEDYVDFGSSFWSDFPYLYIGKEAAYGNWTDIRSGTQYGTNFIAFSFWSTQEGAYKLRIKKIYCSNTMPV